MSTVLVTGALGAIGSWVVRRLVAEEIPFVAFDARADFSLLPDLQDRFELVQGDILDRAQLGQIVREHGVRRILHLAALMPPACEADPPLGYRINLLGALNVFEVAREQGLERVVFMSSKAQYGTITGEHAPPAFAPIPESYRGVPVDVYGSTKLALEDAARHYRRLFGLDLLTLRLGSTYGPGKLARHGAVGLKSRIVEAGFHGEPFEVPDPDHRDDVVYNLDVARAVVLAAFAQRPEHWQFNIAGGELVSLREFAREVMRLCPQHRLTLGPSAGPQSPGTSGLMSIERARAELGYVPEYPGTSGIAHYLEHLQRLVPGGGASVVSS